MRVSVLICVVLSSCTVLGAESSPIAIESSGECVITIHELLADEIAAFKAEMKERSDNLERALEHQKIALIVGTAFYVVFYVFFKVYLLRRDAIPDASEGGIGCS
jgi:hypothetical protein